MYGQTLLPNDRTPCAHGSDKKSHFDKKYCRVETRVCANCGVALGKTALGPFSNSYLEEKILTNKQDRLGWGNFIIKNLKDAACPERIREICGVEGNYLLMATMTDDM